MRIPKLGLSRTHISLRSNGAKLPRNASWTPVRSELSSRCLFLTKLLPVLSDFDHSSHFQYSKAPNPAWLPGDGLARTAPAGIDQGVYDMFDKSRTQEGQRELFKQIDPADSVPGDICEHMI